MGNALQNCEVEETSVGLDVRDALAAAIQRSMDVGCPKSSILDYVSPDDWKTMDETTANINVASED